MKFTYELNFMISFMIYFYQVDVNWFYITVKVKVR